MITLLWSFFFHIEFYLSLLIFRVFDDFSKVCLLCILIYNSGFRINRFRVNRFWINGFRINRLRINRFRINRFRINRFRINRFRINRFRINTFRKFKYLQNLDLGLLILFKNFNYFGEQNTIRTKISMKVLI